MIRTTRRATATLAAGALIAGGLSVATFAPTAAAAPGVCTAANPTETITVFGFNDFHGRVIDDGRKVDDPARYLAGALFTPVEQARVAQGDDHVLLLSSGDNIGASTFVSMIEDDTPTIDILNAAGVDASAVGNHEFDKGWTDLSGRVVPGSSFANLGANVYLKGTTTVAAPLKEYEIVTKAGLDIAIVGAVTGDVPSLVSPGGITALDFGDPVAAINRVTDKLLDGDPTNGEADIVLASIHEGAGNGALSAADNAAASGAFDDIYRRIDDRVSVIFNGHTHQEYSYASANGGRPIIQASSYAAKLAKVDLVVDTVDGGVCTTTPTIIKPGVADESLPAIKEINDIARAAYTSALEKGERVIGTATQAISTAGDGGSGTRNQESPMTNTVAQMFADVLGGGDPEVIGVQNAGGTRDSFNAGDITYREAAMTLPFANSLFTVDLTGAQFTKVLEQQWQRDKEGNRAQPLLPDARPVEERELHLRRVAARGIAHHLRLDQRQADRPGKALHHRHGELPEHRRRQLLRVRQRRQPQGHGSRRHRGLGGVGRGQQPAVPGLLPPGRLRPGAGRDAQGWRHRPDVLVR
ncbi:bifunctional metallophosphatase/5'-nucleotidase [Tessaracoccus defluvii]|uniref:Bifunctional metallophosphatase/5'-nucleotidase n=1 Tax=Tessaracoccus defluvii TaxID=1285901 RepID=A0A7H0H3P2_9ACTN|nr:bifunctional UDP-sugar hydrolase/5'-nucleotidase [Tessaracoccus defluvii]QNP55158.1 bifunctional metallophosphatase/5'-nucleotidase [Tessaracoccus defluvii]